MKLSLLIAFFFGVSTSLVWGDTITYTNYTWSGGNATINYSGVPQESIYGGAGPITLATTPSLTVYCVDIFDWLQSSGTLSVISPEKSLSANDANFVSDVSNLIRYVGTSPTTANGEAAQIAIWNLEYNGVQNGYVVEGPLTVTPDDPSIMSIVSKDYAFLGLNGSSPGIGYVPGFQDLNELTAPGNQSLVVDGIPEPSSMILTISVLGLMFVRFIRMEK